VLRFRLRLRHGDKVALNFLILRRSNESDSNWRAINNTAILRAFNPGEPTETEPDAEQSIQKLLFRLRL
jgi:hypothetical protein